MLSVCVVEAPRLGEVMQELRLRLGLDWIQRAEEDVLIRTIPFGTAAGNPIWRIRQ